MLKKQQAKLIQELERRAGIASTDARFYLTPEPSPLQKQILLSDKRFKVLRAGRRAGKSFICMYKMVLTALEAPRMPILYIGLTRDSAKEIMWDSLRFFLEENKVPHIAHDSTLRITFQNGSTIRLVGADMKKAQDRLRGKPFKLVVADEVAFSQDADNMVSILLPSVSDYEGSIWMASSPGAPTGYFYEADQDPEKSKNWEHWIFTMKDNPFYAGRWEEEMRLACELKFGGDYNHPMFKQEYLAEWIHDETNLLFPYTERNIVDIRHDIIGRPFLDIPSDACNTIFGLDFGITDKTVLVVCKYSDYRREFYIVDSMTWDRIVPEEFAEQLKIWMEKYPPRRIIADCGGLGKVYAEALTRIYRLPIEPAEKIEKAAYIRLMGSDLYSGFIKIVPNHPILAQWSKLLRDKETGIEVQGQECDLADAALYAWRHAYTYTFAKMTPKLSIEDQMFDYAQKQVLGSMSEEREEDIYG